MTRKQILSRIQHYSEQLKRTRDYYERIRIDQYIFHYQQLLKAYSKH